MSTPLSTLVKAKYDEHTTNLSSKRRRLSEISEKDLTKINMQMSLWNLGAISGNSSLQTDALTEISSILDDASITPPASVIGATVTESTTRRGVAVTIAAGSNAITFSSAMPAATYSLQPFAYTATGGMIQISVDPASRTVNGFTLIAASAGKLDYIALYN
jgi:hypothetical protein